MNHEAAFVYSTLYYFSSLSVSFTEQKGEHAVHEEPFIILLSSAWTMCALVLYPRAALMTGLLSHSQDFLWHSPPWHLNTSQTSINSHLQHLGETRGYCPHLESQHTLGWKGPSVQPPCHGTSLYYWQAKARQKNGNKKVSGFPEKQVLADMAEALFPATAVTMQHFCKPPTAYNCNSRHQIWARGALDGAGKGQTYLDHQKPPYFTRVWLA